MLPRFISFALIGFMISGLAAGCGEEGPPPPPPTATYPIVVKVKTPEGKGVPKAPVLFGEKIVGYTDVNGLFEAELTRRSGQELTISVGAVDGYRYLNDSTVTETLRTVDSVDGNLTGVPLALDVDAQSLRNDYFFWVRAKCDENLPDGYCEGLEVKLEDEVVATTNDLGYAQFVLSRVPETEVEIVIDTPSYDTDDDDPVAMEPSDPEYKVALALEPQVYLITEEFVDALAKKRRPRRTYRRKPTRTNRRSSSSKTRTSKTKTSTKDKSSGSEIKEDKDGVIDLF